MSEKPFPEIKEVEETTDKIFLDLLSEVETLRLRNQKLGELIGDVQAYVRAGGRKGSVNQKEILERTGKVIQYIEDIITQISEVSMAQVRACFAIRMKKQHQDLLKESK